MKISVLSLIAAVVVTTIVTAAPLRKRAPPITNNRVLVGYWNSASQKPLSSIDFTKVTHVNFAYGLLLNRNPDPATISFDNPTTDLAKLQELTTLAHANNVKVLLSIGGLIGSQTFSNVVVDPLARARFIQNALVFVKPNTAAVGEPVNGYGLDGIDIAWEFPGRAAAPCNAFRTGVDDYEGILDLVGELRDALDQVAGITIEKKKLLTAALDRNMFLPQLKYALDWASFMAWDYFDPKSNYTRPNSDFNMFTQAADNSLTSNGFPSFQIVIGVPFFGQSSMTLTNMNAQNPLTEYVEKSWLVPQGGPSDKNVSLPYCYTEGNKPSFSGQWTWDELRSQGGPLSGVGYKDPVPGWTFHGEWVFDEIHNTYVSFTSPEQMAIRGQWILKVGNNQDGFHGAMVSDLSADHNNELLTALAGELFFDPALITTTTPIRTGPSTTPWITCTPPCNGYTTGPSTTTTTTSPITTTTTPTTTTTTTTTTTQTIVSLSTSAQGCYQMPDWDKATIYVAGNWVTFHNFMFMAKWWTVNEVPGTTGEWGVWTKGVAC